MRQLYHSTVDFFEDSASLQQLHERPSDELRKEVLEKLGDEFKDAIESHFELMPTRYFRFRGVKPICRHIRLAKSLLDATSEDSAVSADSTNSVDSEKRQIRHRWSATPEQSCSQFVICSPDRPELLAVAAGAIASQNLNILSADFFLRNDGIVVDMFRVCTVDFEPVMNEKTQHAVTGLLERWSAGESIELEKRICRAACAVRKTSQQTRGPRD